MARPKRRLSQAERDERRRRDRERLAEATRALLSSEGWRAWLRARATLHSYRLHNTLLIAHEAGRRGFTPTHVAGFKAWLGLGRCVRKGERGIAILAPVRVKQRDEDGDETGETRLLFRPVHVFDVSQTEPLPGIAPAPLGPPRAPVEGDSHAALLAPLEVLARELGYRVAYRELKRLDGLCDHRKRRIEVADRLAANARVSVLVHELAHALVGRKGGSQDSTRSSSWRQSPSSSARARARHLARLGPLHRQLGRRRPGRAVRGSGRADRQPGPPDRAGHRADRPRRAGARAREAG